MIANITEVKPSGLLSKVHEVRDAGFRFVTATCIETGQGAFDVIYHFDKEFDMEHIKISVQKGEEVPSISRIFFCALLVENEMKELFGVDIKGIAIDYGGHMLLAEGAPETPMCGGQITIVQKGEEQNV